jgi:hypothetical protein
MMKFWLLPLLTEATYFPPTSDFIYCYKNTNGLAKALIYAFATCYEVELLATNQFTFYWNRPDRKNIKPNNVTDFGIGCADLPDYLNGGECYYGPDTNVNCGILYERLEYLNRVMPIDNVRRSLLDYREAERRGKRFLISQGKSPCSNIVDGVNCRLGDTGVVKWYP